VDIGDAGRPSDGGAFTNSNFGRAFDNDTLGIPLEMSHSHWKLICCLERT